MNIRIEKDECDGIIIWFENENYGTGIQLSHIVNLVVCVLIIFGISYLMGDIPCSAKANAMGLDHSFNIVKGCFVNHPTYGWIPFDKLFVLIGK